MVNGIDLDRKNKEYDPAEVLLNSNNSDDFEKFNFNNDEAPFFTNTSVCSPKTVIIQQTTSDFNILDKLYMLCIGSKSSQIIRKDKSMTANTSKLEQMHTDLWEPHKPAFKSGSSHAGIFIYKHTQKMWTLYLQGKNNFIDAFQA